MEVVFVLVVLCLALLQPCADHSLSVALWLTRRLGLYDGPCQTSSLATGSWSPPPLFVIRDSFSRWTWARVQTARSTAYFNGWPYIFWYTFILLIIKSVTDVLRAQSRFVKFAEPPTHFTNLLWVRGTSVTDLITSLSRQQPLFSRK